MRVIGIDVGGTNTDAVLLQDNQVLHAVKTPTTSDVTSGITLALNTLLAEFQIEGKKLDAVMIGTTHFTNAVVQRQGLVPVAAIRIGLPATSYLEPFIDWPSDLTQIVRGTYFMVAGGHEFDGHPIVPFDTVALKEAARAIRDSGIRSVAITSVFSPLNPDCEEEAAKIIGDICPDIAITLSHHLGRIGLLPRENATMLNASLIDLAGKIIRGFTQALTDCGIQAPLYLTQNDGTVMRAEYAEAFPVFSFASGPTNSMRGAALLSGLDDALVVDVGGTTTDIGCLKTGFPREANNVVEIGGVRTLFRMPDLLSIGLGGGSLIQQDPIRVGPQSVGYQLTERSLVFGGEELTCTDIAVAGGLIELGDPTRGKSLPSQLIKETQNKIHQMIDDAVDRMKTDMSEIPLIAVGGGAFLVPEKLSGISEVVHVPHQEVANAVGAAIAQVSGEADQIFQNMSREEAILQARHMAEEKAVKAGANPSTLR